MPIDPTVFRDGLADYRDQDNPYRYICPEQCDWDNAEDMLLSSDAFLGLCGCGLQTDFDYILGGLEIVDEERPQDVPWETWWPAHKEREAAHFGNDAAAQFFYKWADNKGLTEHGGSVPGWLREDTGKKLLALMREAKEASDASE